MKKYLSLLLMLLCLMGAALAAEIPEAAQLLIPADAEITADQSLGEYRALTLELSSGEILQLVFNHRTGELLSLISQSPAASLAHAPKERAALEELLHAAYPDAQVFALREGEAGARILSVFTPTLCGEITMGGEGILSRTLNCGSYMDVEQNRLTMAGALAVMQLHRPEADFRALELDEEDGILVYEGDAWVGGVEYEFELNASTGKLLEWERD